MHCGGKASEYTQNGAATAGRGMASKQRDRTPERMHLISSACYWNGPAQSSCQLRRDCKRSSHFPLPPLLIYAFEGALRYGLYNVGLDSAILLRDGLLTGPLAVPLVTQRFRTRGWDNEGGLDKAGPQSSSAARSQLPRCCPFSPRSLHRASAALSRGCSPH